MFSSSAMVDHSYFSLLSITTLCKKATVTEYNLVQLHMIEVQIIAFKRKIQK